MIQGHIASGTPILEIAVRGKKAGMTLEGVLDTGFDGHVCLPISIAVHLGLELTRVVSAELADGTVLEDELVFAGQVTWDGALVDVDILLTRSEDVLIGTSLLSGHSVSLDYQRGKVLIESPQAGS